MMTSNKRFITRIAWAFFFLIPVSLGACSGIGFSNSTSQDNLKAPLAQQVYRTVGEVQTLDPARVDDLTSRQAVTLVLTGLVSLDDKFNVRPQMALSWEVAPDGLTWTFHLKNNLKFSDGTPLTSHDMAYSIDRALQPATNSPDCLDFLGVIKDAGALYTGQISSIIGDSIFTPDDTTLIITTDRKAPYFLSALTDVCSYPVEKKLIQKYGAHFTNHLNQGGCDGPFIISSYKPTHSIDFVPDPYYYGLKPQLRKITFAFYQDSDNSYQGYQLGMIDMTPISITHIDTARSFSDFHQIPLLATDFFMMNYLTKPFDNIHIRQAFALAINRNTIAQTLLHGLAIATYHLIPQGAPDYNPNLTGPAGVTDTAGDPSLAKTLFLKGLHEEGWTSISQMPPITLTYYGYPGDLLTNAVISMWHDVLGVKITPDPVSDFGTFESMVNATRNNPNGLQFWTENWGDIFVDPRGFTTQLFDRGATDNTVNYGQNNSTDALEQQAVQANLEIADSNGNQQARYAAYQTAEQQLINDVAWMPIFQNTNAFLLKPYVKGLALSTLELIPPDDWARIYIAPH